MNIALVCFVLMTAGQHLQMEKEAGDATATNHDASRILRALPADTLLAVTVRDLAALDGKLTKLTERLGFPFSPYTLMKGSLEIVTGWDDAGSAAVAVMAPEQGAAASKRIVLLLPTQDRSALLTFLNPQPLEDEYLKVTLRGRETYVGTRGPFTVFGPNLETVQHVVRADASLHDRFTIREIKRFVAGDVSLWLNPSALPSGSLTEVNASPLRRAAGVIFESLKQYGSLQLSLQIEVDGLAVEVGVEQAAQPVGRHTLPPRETTDSLLRGLPAEPFVLAMGLTDDHAGTRFESIVNLVFSASAASGIIEPEKSAELRRAYEAVLPKIAGASSGVSVLPEGPDGRIGTTKVLDARGDAQALLRDMETIWNLFKAGPFVDPRINQVMTGIEYRRAAETSHGVTIDHVFLDVSGFEAVDEEMLKKVIGREGLLIRIGAIDGKTVVIAMGGGLSRFEKIVATVRAGRAPLAADVGIARSAKKVATRRSLEAYFSLDRCAELIELLLGAMKQTVALPDMPELNAPLAVTVHAVGPRATQVDVFIPIELVVAVKDAMMARLAGQTGAEH